MFGSRKKPDPPKKRTHDLSQFGLMEIPDDFDPSAGFGGDDSAGSDLEAELAAIAGGAGARPKPKPKPKANLLPASDLDRMIADSMRDIGSDDDDDDIADDELLGELHDIGGGVDEDEPVADAPPEAGPSASDATQTFLPTTTQDVASIIRQRIELYKAAEANAKATNEASKARRFGRGLKTLNDLLKQANAGKSINVDDIPPEINVKPMEPQPTPPSSGNPSLPSSPSADANTPTRAAPPPPSKPVESSSPVEKSSPEEKTSPEEKSSPAEKPLSNVDRALVEEMRGRQNQYKAAALKSKHSGDTETALMFLKVFKQFDVVIKMYEEGKEVDLSDMPPSPDQFKAFMEQMQGAAGSSAAAEPEKKEEPAPTPAPAPQEPAEEAPATTVLGALQQRLSKYKSVEDAAKAEGNSSKARRFGRIVKQYEDAIKLYKAGRPVPFDELPIPPGFGPLPTEGNTTAPAAQPAQQPSEDDDKPSCSKNSSSTPSTPVATPVAPKKSPSPLKPQDLTTRTSGNQQKNNLAEQQMKILLDRQKEFKMAALEAKKSGEIEQAKEYLKIYKGFDALLNAASSGLPVDLNTLPLPPSQRENLEESFAIISAEEENSDDVNPDEDMSDISVRVEEQLAKQLMMCKNTRDHHKAMGDVAGMNRFENLALTVQKDLDLVRYSKRKNFPLPKFHYEKRSFNIVHCNTDLTDNELEIVILRGLNYNVANPKDVDTYVKIEFPLPNDESFKTKTTLIKDTDSPEYDQRFKVEIQRSSRQFQRIFKRHGVKLEVYSRGGFLRSDVLIGTVNVKLQPLETKCDIHNTFDLMDGRKSVGGKIEVKIRVRNPILTKQIEHINEKWLVIDS